MFTSTQREAVCDGFYALGHSLLEQSRYDDAAEIFRTFVMMAPRDERAWLGLGECHRSLGQPLTALEMLGTGIMLATSTVRLLLARARILRALERDGEADVAFDTARTRSLGDVTLETLVDTERNAS